MAKNNAGQFSDTQNSFAAKTYAGETHRTISPAETISHVKPLMARMGITRVANVTGLDRIGLPVVMVTRPNSRSVAVAQGKGLTLEAATASGLMEAVETWHGERIQLPLKYASYTDILNDCPVVDVKTLPHSRGGRFQPNKRLLWIEGEDIAGEQQLWVPYEMVHTDYTLPVPSGHGCFSCSTNGLASGNHLYEAQCHAMCELIERDALSVWHARAQNERAATRVKLETVDNAYCQRALGLLEQAGFNVFVWDTMNDIEVSSFYCLIAEKGNTLSHVGAGSGCHLNPGIALLRAITEAAQTRMTYISGARDDMWPGEFSEQGITQKHQMVHTLVGDGEPQQEFSSAKTSESKNFSLDRQTLVNTLTKAGLGQVIFINLSRTEIGIPVVRSIIPGLEAPHDEDDYVAGPRARNAAGRSS
ncbi:MAG: YcaO-like family protein [Hyphomicrobiales bacterium]